MFEKIKAWLAKGQETKKRDAFSHSSPMRDLSDEIETPTRSYGDIDPLNDMAGILHPHRHW